ncbi:hypothetical protein DB41_DQ00030 [Neochlamydia sp. TUME1]|nr:hypothetical protein DB41_DQ00030 [Neochlamydia sp. TUME1]
MEYTPHIAKVSKECGYRGQNIKGHLKILLAKEKLFTGLGRLHQKIS